MKFALNFNLKKLTRCDLKKAWTIWITHKKSEIQMRSIESLKEEIQSVKGLASLMKWLGIVNAIGSVGVGISEQSLSVFCVGMLGAFLFMAVWSGYASRIQRMEEEIEERHSR